MAGFCRSCSLWPFGGPATDTGVWAAAPDHLRPKQLLEQPQAAVKQANMVALHREEMAAQQRSKAKGVDTAKKNEQKAAALAIKAVAEAHSNSPVQARASTVLSREISDAVNAKQRANLAKQLGSAAAPADDAGEYDEYYEEYEYEDYDGGGYEGEKDKYDGGQSYYTYGYSYETTPTGGASLAAAPPASAPGRAGDGAAPAAASSSAGASASTVTFARPAAA